ncbi:MAG TPA: hypothetical protein VFQ92_07910 [Blastocatellia bacterium]|nr:hypothetical protein [Blastocatellia bacterium]
MRRIEAGLKILVMFMLTLSALAPLESRSQDRRPAADTAFARFWTKFKAAVAKDDKEAVADMTKLPFMLENRDLDRAGFIQKYNLLFDRKTKRCFATAKPLKDGDLYQLFCGQQIFLFDKVEGVYKFTEIGVND